jgi:hypothetical protein
VKGQKRILFSVALILIAATAGGLNWIKTHQKLGRPGIMAAAIPGSLQMKIDLPERVLDFTSTNIPEPEVVLGYLPPDTSYAERIYTSPDGFQVQGTIVLMGADRTSIHKPDYCLPGQGWRIDSKNIISVPVGGARPFELPVAKWVISANFQMPDGQTEQRSGIYAFWFVADNEQTPDFYGYLRRLTRDFLFTGVLQRWAYVSYFCVCAPGQEDAAFARLEKLIAASVPEFQPPPAGR